MALVYTGGTFDLLHAGHIDFLKACKHIAGKTLGEVIVALNTDAFVERFKGRKPICNYEERRKMLEGCRYVDRIIENFGNEDAKKTLATLVTQPDFIVIGDDWAKKDYYAQMQFTPEWLADHGITLLYVARQRHLSTTEIKRRSNQV